MLKVTCSNGWCEIRDRGRGGKGGKQICLVPLVASLRGPSVFQLGISTNHDDCGTPPSQRKSEEIPWMSASESLKRTSSRSEF